MRVLLDEQLPHKLRPAIVGHDVFTVRYMGWDGCRNGELLRRAEAQFDVFITADQNLTHQQRVRGRHLAVLVLAVPDMRLPTLLPLVAAIMTALRTIQAGEVVEITTEAAS